ncbi:hypothetical protein [Brevibacillus formosus]|uniref:hypothetical protein n=1 Tax=Brevibacillus formosus TaxID=54913 RepID=UPI003F1B7AF3
MKILVSWLVALLSILSVFGISAYAIDFKITDRQEEPTSFGGIKNSLVFSVQNAKEPEIGVGTRITYTDGTKGGSFYYCRPDGSGCRDTYALYRYYTYSPRSSDKVVAKIEFYVMTKNGDGKVLETLTYGKVDPKPDPGGGDPGDGTDPGDGDPGDGTDPGDGDPGGGTDPGGGSGGCGCVDRIADMIVDLQDSIDQQGYDLSRVKKVADRIEGIVEDNGYKLDAVQDSIDALESSLVSRLDRANDSLDRANNTLNSVDGTLKSIDRSLTPTFRPTIPNPDWDSLSKQNENSTLNQINRVTDNNVYFSDPGQGQSVPAMPAQPEENYPVPIGKSLDKEKPLQQQPSLSRNDPITSQPPLKVQPPLNVDKMTPDPVPERTPIKVDPPMKIDPPMKQDQLKADPPMKVDPPMKADPPVKQDRLQSDPTLDRTNFYERK